MLKAASAVLQDSAGDRSVADGQSARSVPLKRETLSFMIFKNLAFWGSMILSIYGFYMALLWVAA